MTRASAAPAAVSEMARAANIKARRVVGIRVARFGPGFTFERAVTESRKEGYSERCSFQEENKTESCPA